MSSDTHSLNRDYTYCPLAPLPLSSMSRPAYEKQGYLGIGEYKIFQPGSILLIQFWSCSESPGCRACE